MKLIDAHTHLSSDTFDVDRSEVLQRTFDVCEAVIDIGSGTSKDAFENARRLADSDPRVFFTAGIHPHDAEKLGNDAEICKAIEALLSHPKCVAVGECGLDYFYEHSKPEEQMKCFQWQIELAKKFNLPLMIHTRDAEDDTKKLLDGFSGVGAFHCFTGTQSLADYGLSKNFCISFSGIVTFKNAEDLRSVAKSIPMDSILVETDSPYLAPVPMRGKRNESSFISHTAAFLAQLKGVSEPEFILATNRNTRRIFSKMGKTIS